MKESLILTQKISDDINNQTFHHHYYILFDLGNLFEDKTINYVEIGCYAGGSSCLMLQRPNTNVVSIDLGTPINPDIVKGNVDKLNVLNNQYTYIKGDSQLTETYNKLIDVVDNIDILFIDGDHSYDGVIKDFEMYSNLVNKGGYIIFDDYNDKEYSPSVKIAVDHIVKNLTDYEIIGTIPNEFGARPENMKDGNCFIIKKIV
jgi:predicted O-methyltransferase YrrM